MSLYCLLMASTAHKPTMTPAPQAIRGSHVPVMTLVTTAETPVAKTMPAMPGEMESRMFFLGRDDS